MTTAIAARVVDSSRTLISGIGDNAAYTLVAGDSGKIVIAAAAQDDDEEFRTGNSHSIEYRASGAATFLSLPTSGTAAVPRIDTANTTLSNNTNVSNANRRVSTGPSGGQSFLAAGKEFVTAQSLNYGDRCRDDFTEAQFAIDFSLCGSGTAWEFRTRWEDDGGATTNGTCPTVTTAAASGTTHSLADTTGSIEPTHTSSVTVTVATVTHSLAHTAGAITTSTSASSITADQTHNLVHTAGLIEPTQTAALTVTSTHSLAHTTDSIEPTHDSTLKLTHSLAHTTDTIAPTHDSTLKLTHSLAHTTDTIAPTHDSTLKLTHSLAHTAGLIDITQDTAAITAERIHNLAHTTGLIEPTHDSALKLTHSLTHTAGLIEPDATTADITAVQTHDLAVFFQFGLPLGTIINLGANESFVTAAITADQTHDLADTADSIEPTQTTADITSNRIHNLVHTTGSIAPTYSAALTVAGTHNLAHTTGSITTTSLDTTKLTRSLVHTTDLIEPAQDTAALTATSTHNLQGSFFTSLIGIVSEPSGVKLTRNLFHTDRIDLTHTAAALVLTVHRLAHTAGLIEPTHTAALTVTSTHNLEHTAGTIQVTQDTAALTVTSTHNLSATDLIEPTHDAAVVLIHSLVHDRPLSDWIKPFDTGSEVQAKVVISLQGTGTVSDPTDVSRIESATYHISVTIDGVGDLAHNLLKRSEIMSLEEIWNTGLTQLGVGTVDSAVSDQTGQAILLRKVWDNFRKQFVSDHAWNGCKTTAALTKLADSDFKDTTRWGNVFSLPSDYLRALTVNGHPNQAGNAERVMWEIEIVSDTAGAKSRCICTNQSTAKLEYVFDPGDANIGTFLAPAMKHALGLAFAAFVAPNFGKSTDEITMIEQKAREALLKARGIDGQESSGIFFGPSELVESRYRSS